MSAATDYAETDPGCASMHASDPLRDHRMQSIPLPCGCVLMRPGKRWPKPATCPEHGARLSEVRP